MEGSTVSTITELLVNVLIGSFSLAVLSWVAVGIHIIMCDRRREKREKEYHQARMKDLSK